MPYERLYFEIGGCNEDSTKRRTSRNSLAVVDDCRNFDKRAFTTGWFRTCVFSDMAIGKGEGRYASKLRIRSLDVHVGATGKER